MNSRIQLKVGRTLLALSSALFLAAGGAAQAGVYYVTYNGAWNANQLVSGDYVSVAGRSTTNSDVYAAKNGASVDLISGGIASPLGLSLNYNSLSAVLDNTGFMWGANTSGGVDYLNYFGGWVSSPLVSGSYLSVSANNSSSGSLYASKSGGGIDYIYYTGGGVTGWEASTLLSTTNAFRDIAPQYGNNGMMWAVTSTGAIERIDYSGGWVQTPIISGNYISVANAGANGFAYAARADGGIDYIAYSGGWIASSLLASSTVYTDLAADLQGNGFMFATGVPFAYWAPGVGGGGTGTWSSANTNWATSPGVQGSGIQSPADTLIFGNASGTVDVSGGVNAAAGMTFSTDGYSVTNSTITLTGANAASNTITTAASVGATISSQLAGSNGMTKAGTGTLTFGGPAANTLTGTTTVSAGTLQLNKSASTTAIVGNLEVATGATLLISQSEQVNDASAVTLSGGTIAKGSGAITETFGALTLGANSSLDFGSGTGNFTFSTYNPASFDLKFENFNLGNSFTVNTGTFTASEFDFNGFGYSWDVVPSGGFTITAIPEPSTVLTALGLAGMMLWPARRRLFRVVTGSREG